MVLANASLIVSKWEANTTTIFVEGDSMTYPATLEIEHPGKIGNWRPLVHWLLVIPHSLVLSLLGIVATLVAMISWLLVLITGKLPEGLANFQCMYLRYSTRVTTYLYGLHVQYPPFSFDTTAADPGGSPVAINFTPALTGRNRLTVLIRFLMVIPAYIMLAVYSIVGAVVSLVGFFAVLFTGSWPNGMFDIMVKVVRFQLAYSTYALLLTDEYPPLGLE